MASGLTRCWRRGWREAFCVFGGYGTTPVNASTSAARCTLMGRPLSWFMNPMDDIPQAQNMNGNSEPPCVWRSTPRGPSTSEIFLQLIAEIQQPLRCIQGLWRREPDGWGIELTAFFQGFGYDSAVLLGGIHGNGERRVLGGSCPPFLEVAVAKAIGEALAHHFSAALYFPLNEHPDDRSESWLDCPRDPESLRN